MITLSTIRASSRCFSNLICGHTTVKREALIWYPCLVHNVLNVSDSPRTASYRHYFHYVTSSNHSICQSKGLVPDYLCKFSPTNIFLFYRSCMPNPPSALVEHLHARHMSTASVELNTDEDIVRFSISKQTDKKGSQMKGKKRFKPIKMSRKAKLNELRFYRLKAKKKMKSPNPEVRIRYNLAKAKRKEAWLIEKLRKYELPKGPTETYDPEILTEEERFYLKRTGEKRKNYVPVGRRGVFGGVVLNMHLHWKKHETVKVICKPCKPGQIHEYAAELARLSKGIVIDIRPGNTVIFYRGKNYVRPDVMSPPDTLSKAKAMEKYRFEQSLEHTSQFIEKLEKELEDYHQHLARYKNEKKNAQQDSVLGI